MIDRGEVDAVVYIRYESQLEASFHHSPDEVIGIGY